MNDAIEPIYHDSQLVSVCKYIRRTDAMDALQEIWEAASELCLQANIVRDDLRFGSIIAPWDAYAFRVEIARSEDNVWALYVTKYDEEQ